MTITNIKMSPEALLAGIVAIADAIGPECHAKMSAAIVRTQRLAADSVAADLELRDRFAAAALPALIGAVYSLGLTHEDGTAVSAQSTAAQAYHFADAMLAARGAA